MEGPCAPRTLAEPWSVPKDPPSIRAVSSGLARPRPDLVVMEMTPAWALGPQMPDCGPRITSIRAMLSTGRLARSASPEFTSLMGMPSTTTRTWLDSAPRTRVWVRLPRPPDWLTATPGTRRSTSGTLAAPWLAMSSAVMTVTAEPTRGASSGTLLAPNTVISGSCAAGSGGCCALAGPGTRITAAVASSTERR